jgi:hypothetical protein
MKNSVRLWHLLTAALILTLALAPLASAVPLASQTWVSGSGSDGNPCTRTQPCATFQGAILKTAAGGEIDALDTAEYGAVGTLSISQSITIDGGAGHAATIVASAGQDAIEIGSAAGSTVTLRNIELQGLGPSAGVNQGATGISVGSGSYVHLENVKISGFASNGVAILETTQINVSMVNVSISDITGAGVFVLHASETQAFSIDDSHIFNTGQGILAATNSQFMIRDSVLAYNSIGLDLLAGSVTARNCEISYNATGIQSAAGTSLAVLGNTITYNTTAFSISRNTSVSTDGANELYGNTSNGNIGNGTLTTTTKQ